MALVVLQGCEIQFRVQVRSKIQFWNEPEVAQVRSKKQLWNEPGGAQVRSKIQLWNEPEVAQVRFQMGILERAGWAGWRWRCPVGDI